uniref:Uncharacterized protein n=1 Tax=Schizaphis graminum TaxID=13262 RepID=A0A2S2NTJ3_SCHGA
MLCYIHIRQSFQKFFAFQGRSRYRATAGCRRHGRHAKTRLEVRIHVCTDVLPTVPQRPPVRQTFVLRMTTTCPVLSCSYVLECSSLKNYYYFIVFITHILFEKNYLKLSRTSLYFVDSYLFDLSTDI